VSSAYYLFAASGLYQVREVRPNVFAWIADDVVDQESDPEFTRAGNAGFLITPEGIVVVDTTNSPFHARELLYEIRQRTDMPVRYVIDTSASGDEMLGNEVFVDQQATLISTSAARDRIRTYGQELARRLQLEEDAWRLGARMRGFHVTPTSQTFESQMTLRLGGQEIKLVSLLPDGEAAVSLPSARIVFLGSLFQNKYFPIIDSRDVHRWIEALRQTESWNADTYIPAHGEPGSKKDLAEFRGFLEWLIAQVEGRIKQGKSLAQVKKELLLPETFHWHAADIAPNAVEAVYRQLSEAPPAQAGAPKATESPHLNPPAQR
jgi:glyoxylase-like metal-dependent hydrolase (beta-lactamase superfamily II)